MGEARSRAGTAGAIPDSTPAGPWLSRLGMLAFAGYALLSVYLASRWSLAGLGMDLRFRWVEVSYVAAGVDPWDVLNGHVGPLPGLPTPEFTYGPWAYLLGLAFVLPVEFPLALSWYVLVVAASLVLFGAWSWRLGADDGRPAQAFMVMGALASIALPTSLRNLNYSLVACGCLAAYALAEDRGRPVLAGIALGLATVKPQLAALFFLVPLFRRSWLSLTVAAAFPLASLAGAGVILGKSPLLLLRQFQSESLGYANAYMGIFHMGLLAGWSRQAVVLAGAISGVTAALLLLWRYRPALPAAMAAMGVLATVWSYHRPMDLLVVGFLVAALARLQLREPNRTTGLVLWAVCLSYWVPNLVRFAMVPVIPELFRLVWLLGALHLLSREAAPPRPAGSLA